MMRRHIAVLSTVLCSVLLVSGCKSTKHGAISTLTPKVVVPSATASTSAAVSATPIIPPSVAASSSSASSSAPAPASSSSASPTQAAPTTTLDPCQLVTSAEASALAGTTFGPGVESAPNASHICVYGGKTTNVFVVVAAQAADSKTANDDWAQEEAQAQAALASQVPTGVAAPKVADVSGIGDRAATATASVAIQGQTIAISAIYMLKGATFLSYSDLLLNKPAPTVAALEAQATVSLSRIP